MPTAVVAASAIPPDPDPDNSEINTTQPQQQLQQHSSTTNLSSHDEQLHDRKNEQVQSSTPISTFDTDGERSPSSRQTIDSTHSSSLTSNIPTITSTPTSTATTQPSEDNSICRASVIVPRDAVGFIIGKRGETVRNMMTRSSASIEVDRADTSPDAASRLFHIKGTKDSVAAAKQLIREKASAVLHGRPNVKVRDAVIVTNPPQGDSTTPISHTVVQQDDNDDDDDQALSSPIEMRIPRGCVGMIIGHNGQVINEMQDRAGATIVVHNRNVDRDGSKLLTISGGEREKEKARAMIQQRLDHAGSRHRHQERTHHQDQNVFIPSPSAQPHPHPSVPPFPYPAMPFDPRQQISPFPSWIPTLPPVMQQPGASSQNRPQPQLHPQQIRMIPQHHIQPYQMHQVQQPQQPTPVSPFHVSQEQQHQQTPIPHDPRSLLPLNETIQQHPSQSPQPPGQSDVQSQQTQPRAQMPSQMQLPNQSQLPGALHPHTQLPIQPVLSPHQQHQHQQQQPQPQPRQTHPHHQPQSHQHLRQPSQQRQPMQPGGFGNQPVPPHMYPQGAGPAHRNIQWNPPQPTPYSSQLQMGYDTGNFPQPRGTLTKVIRVPSSCVGILIGKEGETIRDLQARSRAYIKVTPERAAGSNDPERLIYIIGRPESLELAHSLINDVVNEGISKTYRDGVRPSGEVNPVTGGDPGTTGRSLEEGSTTEQLESSLGSDRSKQHVSGAKASTAEEIVPKQTEELEDHQQGNVDTVREVTASQVGESMTGASSSDIIPGVEETEQFDEFEGRFEELPATNYPSASVQYKMKIPDAKVGMIIGKNGATIRLLQKKSGARISVSKISDTTRDGKPRVVTITGPEASVKTARRLIIGRIRPSSDQTKYEEENVLESRQGEEEMLREEDMNMLAMEMSRQHIVSGPPQMLPRSPPPMSPMAMGQAASFGTFQGQFPYIDPNTGAQFPAMTSFRPVMRNEGADYRMVESQVVAQPQYGPSHLGMSQFSDQVGGYGYEPSMEGGDNIPPAMVEYRPMYIPTPGGLEMVQAETTYGYGSEAGEVAQGMEGEETQDVEGGEIQQSTQVDDNTTAQVKQETR